MVEKVLWYIAIDSTLTSFTVRVPIIIVNENDRTLSQTSWTRTSLKGR